LALLALALAACGGGGQVAQTQGGAEAGATATGAPEPKPSAKARTACGVHFANTVPNPNGPDAWFTADAELTNTGNVGADVRVTAIFKQAGRHPMRLMKNAHHAYDHSRVVHFRRNVAFEKADARPRV
jgi:hypothetical protein